MSDTHAAASPSEPETPAAGRSLDWIAALVIGVAALALAAFHLNAVQFFCDDSYISFRFAQNFAEGHGLVYNPGERLVHGYWWSVVTIPHTRTSRIVAPYNLTLVEGPCIAFPSGGFWLPNNWSYTGPDVHNCSRRGACAWQQDMSIIGNNPSHRDYFFQVRLF